MQPIYFDPQPDTLPERLASPFAHASPHPLAQRAAVELIARLRDRPGLEVRGAGKMFGVLVVADAAGRVGYLTAFSGMLDGSWQVAGFVEPAFDRGRRDAFWPAGEAELAELAERHRAVAERAAPARAALDEILARQREQQADLRERHRANKRARDLARVGATVPLEQLASLSRADTAEHRRLDVAHRDARQELEHGLAELDRQLAELADRRAVRSRTLLHEIHATYRLRNAAGVERSLHELFAPDPPPGGAGDCAAPKLLACAYRHQLRPLALAELWWGATPDTGGRHAGVFYPACRGKCGPILTHMLDGLPVEPSPVFGTEPFGDDEPRVCYEDPWLIVVDKPIGMLSVPGRSGQLRDSAVVRLRRQFGPEIELVHRLDLETSGLLIAARDRASHAALQRQFARREISKRYAAIVEGRRDGRGTIELALRVDLDDRPRQIADLIHGKPAITDWEAVSHDALRTRVALYPRTGRTHQLRVHAAHPAGLGAPIVGDRLYGTRDNHEPRMLLHAEAIVFAHPHTGARVELISPPAF